MNREPIGAEADDAVMAAIATVLAMRSAEPEAVETDHKPSPWRIAGRDYSAGPWRS